MNKAAKRPGKKTVKKAGKLLAFFLSLCLAAFPVRMECQAAEGYTYTVTFYPGNHGTFNGIGGVSVWGGGTGASVSMEGQAIKVSGLKSGDMVSFDAAMDGTVALEEGSKYYVKGIRLSGRDNNTVDTSAFRVDCDRDYVVAYGIRGDMVSYAVNYQDEAGNALAPGRRYYGNVGDKPVVAFLYVEGYEPMAYNLTKTLVSNEAENVFTFVYTRVASSSGGGASGGGTGGNAGGDNGALGGGMANDGELGAADNNMAGGEAAEGNGTGGNNAMAGDGMADNGGGAADDNMAAGNPGNEADGAMDGNQAGNPDGGEDMTELEEKDVPLDVMELDAEEVPLADNVLPDMEEGSRIFAASAVLVTVSVGVLIFFAFWLKKHSKKTKQK